MEAANQIKPIQNEAFWKHQYELLQSSGMKRSDYCRQNNLNYDRFGYWICRLNRFKNERNELVSIKLKSNEPLSETKTLCTLSLNNGHFLKIHDSTALAIILERYR